MSLRLASTQDSRCMPNLYFCEPENQSHRILRAVLSWEECDHVVDRASATRLGSEFPIASIDGSSQTMIAILYVRPEEANEKWLAGVYRIDADVTDMNQALGTLNRIPAIVSP